VRTFCGAARFALSALWFLLCALLIAWAALAIHFSNLPWAAARTGLALAFVAFSVWILRFSGARYRNAIFLSVFAAVAAWWIAIPPSHDRNWRPEAAVLPRAFIDGDNVRIVNVRNFDYRTRHDFTPRYEERTVQLSHLTGLDFYVSYWREGLVAHTFVSFTFDNAPPLAVSIETRPEVGEGFAPVASIFKQFELIYVVGDERDLVGVRANHRGESTFLYRLNTPSEDARRLFLVYLDRINEIADRPEWYHLLSNNCSLNIIRYANAIGRKGQFDIRHLLNGLFDSYLYHSGRTATWLPFEELRRRSRINAAAQAAGDSADFSARIREGLPDPDDPLAAGP
jgi:hypothetical protein